MAAKRLSEHQSTRIAQREQAVIDGYTTTGTTDYTKSVIVGSLGHEVLVESATGNEVLCKTHRDRTRPVCGDEVLWIDEGNSKGIVEAVLPRRSLLERPDNNGKMRTIAANLDRIVIIIAPKPDFNEGLLDRYLVAASIINVTPIIVLNKVDLLNKDDYADITARLAVYKKLGYEVLDTSAGKKIGITELNTALSGHTCILVGQSGVGKSSLVNQLLPDVDARTNEISEATGKGKHTTTSARLYHMPCGGQMIDSPGIREFGLVHASPEDIQQGYAEIRQAAGQCRFNDCRHQDEPGCAVLAAVEKGAIDPQRYERYQRILESIAD